MGVCRPGAGEGARMCTHRVALVSHWQPTVSQQPRRRAPMLARWWRLLWPARRIWPWPRRLSSLPAPSPSLPTPSGPAPSSPTATSRPRACCLAASCADRPGPRAARAAAAAAEAPCSVAAAAAHAADSSAPPPRLGSGHRVAAAFPRPCRARRLLLLLLLCRGWPPQLCAEPMGSARDASCYCCYCRGRGMPGSGHGRT